MNNYIKRYAVFIPNKKQSFFSEGGGTNMETETSLLYTREGFEALLASGNVKIYKAEKIIQRWLNDKGAKKADNYTMRIRYTAPSDIYGPHTVKDNEIFVERTHTVKHKLSEVTSLEVNTELSKKDYEIIAKHYDWCPEVNKTRLYLICKDISHMVAIVTMDIYGDDEMRLEIELQPQSAEEGITIPDYLFEYAVQPEN